MSRDYGNAVHYARGCGWAGPEDATTLFELQMGLVDRGAELTWLSQYPHEQEVLLPPLSGLEAIGSSVAGKLLKIDSRLSLNLAAQTLEQVLSRRRKMLMDMAGGIEFELRDTLGDGALYKVSLRILRRALAYGALAQTPDWFNDDDNFSQVRLPPCRDAVVELPHVSFVGRGASSFGRPTIAQPLPTVRPPRPPPSLSLPPWAARESYPGILPGYALPPSAALCSHRRPCRCSTRCCTCSDSSRARCATSTPRWRSPSSTCEDGRRVALLASCSSRGGSSRVRRASTPSST